MPTQSRKATRHHTRVFAPAILAIVIAFVAAYQFVDPAPPRQINFATGSTTGAYHLFGQAYKDILARNGIELILRNTAGSVENLGLLVSGQVDVAFVQGGTAAAVDGTDTLVSLGSLYFEPLWLFYRVDAPIERLTDLHTRRVGVGKQGSGSHAVAMQLLNDNRIDAKVAELVELSTKDAIRALRAGGIDAVFAVASPRSPVIKELLGAPDIGLMSFERAEAYSRTHRFLSSVVLPQGVVSFVDNVPPEDVVLLAPAANLVAGDDLHPALISLLLQAATEVHGDGGIFEELRQFPSSAYLELPIDDEAARYLHSGPPFLQRYLPFWAAVLVDRLLVMLLPIVALMIPLFRIMPPMFRWRIRSRIYRWYRELLAIDPVVHHDDNGVTLETRLEELNRIEQEVAKVDVPMSYADQLYHLRLHIDLVREKLESKIARRTNA